jgi:hypothetical protein
MDGMDGEMEAFGVKVMSRAFVNLWYPIIVYRLWQCANYHREIKNILV